MTDFLTEKNDRIVAALGPTIAFVVVLMVLGLVGNTIVFLVYYKRVKPSPTRTYILAMSVCDLLTNVIVLPSGIARIAKYYTFDSPSGCRAIVSVATVLTFCSGFMLVAVAIARYRAVCRPMRSRQDACRKKEAYVAVAVCVVASVVFAVPVTVLHGTRTVQIVGWEDRGTTTRGGMNVSKGTLTAHGFTSGGSSTLQSENGVTIATPNGTNMMENAITSDGTSTEVGTGVDTSTEVGPGVDTRTEVGPGVDTSTEVGPGVATSTEVSTGVDTSTEVGPGVATSTEVGPGVSTSTQNPKDMTTRGGTRDQHNRKDTNSSEGKKAIKTTESTITKQKEQNSTKRPKFSKTAQNSSRHGSRTMSNRPGDTHALESASMSPHAPIMATTCWISDDYAGTAFLEAFNISQHMLIGACILIILTSYILVAKHLWLHKKRMAAAAAMIRSVLKRTASPIPYHQEKFDRGEHRQAEGKQCGEKEEKEEEEGEEEEKEEEEEEEEEDRAANDIEKKTEALGLEELGHHKKETDRVSLVAETRVEECHLHLNDKANTNNKGSQRKEAIGPDFEQHQPQARASDVNLNANGDAKTIIPIAEAKANSSSPKSSETKSQPKTPAGTAKDRNPLTSEKPKLDQISKAQKKVRKIPTRTTLMLFVLTAVFVVNYLPQAILYFANEREIHRALQKNGWRLNFFHIGLKSYYVNSAINCIVYGFTSARFRYECRQLFIGVKQWFVSRRMF